MSLMMTGESLPHMMSAVDEGASGTDIPLWARRLRESRERAGLTQLQLGRIIGRSQQTINGYEHGRKPNIATFRRIAKACGVPETWLVPSEDIVGHTEHPIGRAPSDDQAPPDVVRTGYEESPLFAWTIHLVRKSLADEGVNSDIDQIWGYTEKLLRLSQGESDEAQAKDFIRRTVERDREEFRRQLKILRDRFF